MIEKDMQESGKIFALSMTLMNMLILTIVIGAVWLIQLLTVQIVQFNYEVNKFRLF